MSFKATPGLVRGRQLTAGERDELRHYLQVLMEHTRVVRNAVEPRTGMLGLSVGQWRSQWAAIKKDLDSVTERISAGYPVAPVLEPAASTKEEDETRLSLLAKTLHTGWRKGTDAPQASRVHALIDDMSPADWAEYVQWVDWCLGEVGYAPNSAGR